MKNIKIDNRPLCYIALIILIGLLFLPPALRLFGKNLYVQEETKKDEVIILNCSKQNETINSTFLNGEPQNIIYRINGDYTIEKEEESDDTTVPEEINTNPLIELIKPKAQIEYDENKNMTSFKVKTNDLKEIKDYNVIFNTLENQQKYYNSQTFSCEKINY